MAGITVFVGWYVIGWRRLAPRGGTIVASVTIPVDTRMIEAGIGKGRSDMTHGAILRRRQMILRLAGRGNTIVARGTVINDAGMIEHCRLKSAARCVANIAVLCCRHVIRLGALAGGIRTVVAGITALTHDLGSVVVDKRIGEIRRVMAHAAILAVRRRMCRRHASGTISNMVRTAVVARVTVTGDTLVREYRGYKSCDRVAVVAILPCRQVVLRFEQVRSGRQEFALMTTFATTGNVLMDRRQECG